MTQVIPPDMELWACTYLRGKLTDAARTQAFFTRWAGEPDASESILADFYTRWEGEQDASDSILVPLSNVITDGWESDIPITGIKVSNREPDYYDGSYPLVTVRDDGGSQSDQLVFDRQLGVNVRMGTRSRPKPCRDLAARVYGLLTDPDITLQADCPVAAITWDGCNGPYPVSEDIDIARYYLIVEYSTIGIIQNQ